MPCRQRQALVFLAAFLSPLFTSGSPAVAQVLAQNLIYTSIQPCRLFDTRVAGGALVANTNRQFNAVGVSSAGSLSSQGGNANGCPIPGFDVSSAPQVQAIIVNLTVVTPSGTGVLQAWPSDHSKPNASIMNFTAAEVVIANGAVLPVRQDVQGGDITVVSNVGTHVLADVAGYFSSESVVQGGATANLFLGTFAGNPSVSGQFYNATGEGNTAIGYAALSAATSGAFNTALGGALSNLLTGSNNIGVGVNAGDNYIGGEGNNIVIGSQGVTGDSNTIRIGTPGPGAGQQNSAFIAGIYGTTSSAGTEVFINSSGQLGTTTSSLRFKEDVSDMGEASNDLMNLRPVTFHYKARYDDGSRLLQYGLIAEEVARVYPDLVQYDKDGQPLSVRYSMVNAMMLNELRKQHAKIEEQSTQLDRQQAEIASLRAQVAAQRNEVEVLLARRDAERASHQVLLNDLASRVANLEKTAAHVPGQ